MASEVQWRRLNIRVSEQMHEKLTAAAEALGIYGIGAVYRHHLAVALQIVQASAEARRGSKAAEEMLAFLRGIQPSEEGAAGASALSSRHGLNSGRSESGEGGSGDESAGGEK